MVNKTIISSILVVDDDPEVIQLIRFILVDQKYIITAAENGEKALELVKERSFDLIILDVNMPFLNGFETCKILKESYDTADIPVIFLTGHDMIEDIVNGFDAGAFDYITKPFSPLEFSSRIKLHLELKHSRDLLKEMALMDGLTKLFNHSYIHERLSEEISNAQRHKLPLSLIMIDLDNFKLINDTFGHKTGDNVLVKVSATIKSIIREEDTAGRYGGEEFAIILPNTTQKAAYKVAEKIRTSIKQVEWELRDFSITISGGVHTLENETVNELIEKTDILLYKAKNNGKDKIVSPISENH